MHNLDIVKVGGKICSQERRLRTGGCHERKTQGDDLPNSALQDTAFATSQCPNTGEAVTAGSMLQHRAGNSTPATSAPTANIMVQTP